MGTGKESNTVKIQEEVSVQLQHFSQLARQHAQNPDVVAALKKAPSSIIKGRDLFQLAMDETMEAIEYLAAQTREKDPSPVISAVLDVYIKLLRERGNKNVSREEAHKKLSNGIRRKIEKPDDMNGLPLFMALSSDIDFQGWKQLGNEWLALVFKTEETFKTETALAAQNALGKMIAAFRERMHYFMEARENTEMRDALAAMDHQQLENAYRSPANSPAAVFKKISEIAAKTSPAAPSAPRPKTDAELNREIEDRNQEIFDEAKEKKKKINIIFNKIEANEIENGLFRKQLKELGVADASDDIEKLQEKIDKAGLPPEVREVADKEMKKLKRMSPSSAEYTVGLTYPEKLMSMPWGTLSPLIHDIARARAVLDEDHYGLEKVKREIVEEVAVQGHTTKSKGPIICLVGPPGVGKTSITKSIARATGREFVKISLGGVRDEADIRGHRRTYIGAQPGRFADGFIRAKTDNPLFLLDEVDKMGQDPRGGNPMHALLEVLDQNQNKGYRDHYLDVDYDISKAMFIATANDESEIPGPARDRMLMIRLPGYTQKEKFQIARRYLVPKQMADKELTEDQVSISDGVIRKLITAYTHEAGVRDLEHRIESLCKKAVIEIEMAKSEGRPPKKVEITEANLEEFAGPGQVKEKGIPDEDMVGVINGLSVSAIGGATMQIEATRKKSHGEGFELQVTGNLKEVMTESVQVAQTVIETLVESGRIVLPEGMKLEEMRVHVHALDGAVPKDGPSAGGVLAVAIASALTNTPINRLVAMTGEISAHGKIKPIGGLPQKLDGAMRDGAKIVLIPKANIPDLAETPQSVKDALTIIPISSIEEAFEHFLGPNFLQPGNKPVTVPAPANSNNGWKPQAFGM